ncbi:FadR/GntR family transcriptional regulator [Pseudooceanicola sp. LIPI14-2-Ac024]|uniref:FadR/GntR family transcriptional regulator n=1 Tax=Pseudooceanicola sp. LIPI14-2-Ac024 TaxID=3344875 RepID=UPI0035D12CBA
MTDATSNDLTQGLKPIARKRVSEEVARRIQEVIASRNLKAGDRLPTEREISESLSVGRSAVREGLGYLAALDIIEVRQGAGSFVKEPQKLALMDRDNLGSEERRTRLRQATEARCVLDCAIVEAATRCAAPELIPALQACLEAAETEPERSKRAHAIDLSFEQCIGDHCGNPYMTALQREAHRYFRSTWESVGLMPRPAAERSDQHWHIFEAIKSGDAEEARRRMEEHFRLQALARD